jgi:hypothetical protein
MGMSLFYQLFAGVPMNEMDAFPLIPLGRWLFMIGIYLLIMGFYLGKSRQNQQFIMIRYGFIQKWWQQYFFKNLFGGLLTAMVLLGMIKLIDLQFSHRSVVSFKEIVMISVLWTVHTEVLLALFLLLEVLGLRKMIPAVLLLLEGLTFLSGFRLKKIARLMFGSWGMYVQSSIYENIYGFSIIIVIAIQSVIIVGCYLLGRYVLKNKGKEGI